MNSQSVRSKCSSRAPAEAAPIPEKTLKVLKRFWSFIRPHYKLLAILSVCFVVNQALIVVMPIGFGMVIDKVIPSGNGRMLNWVALGLIGFLVVRSLTIFIERETSALIGSLVVRDVRRKLHGHLLQMSLRYLDNFQVGRIVSRVLGDTECVRQLLLTGFVNGSASCVRLIFILITLLVIDPRMTVISSFNVPLFFIGFWYSANRLKPHYRKLNDNNAALTASVSETFSGMRVVKTYRGERRARLDFVSRLHELLRQTLFVCRTQHLITVFWEATASISVIAMLWYGGHRVLSGSMTLGSLVAFYGLLGQLHGPIADLISLNATLQPAVTSIENLDLILKQQPEIMDKPGARGVSKLDGHVEFCNVDFSYVKNADAPNAPKTLQNIAFKVKGGYPLYASGSRI